MDKADLRSSLLRTLVERGFVKDATNLHALDALCADGPITAYIGFDATARSLHVGSMIQLMVLRHLKAHGHRAIALLGHATTMVGDPSDKDGLRPILGEADIRANADGIHEIVARIVGEDVETVSNAAWHREFGFLEFMRTYGVHFTLNRMLSLDIVSRRLEQQKPMTMMELSYNMMQAIDFERLHQRDRCLLQIGGSDQWSNIVAGVELIRRMHAREAFGITTPLMADEQGRKMGKTAEGKAIWLDASLVSSFDLWQFWRNVPDAKVGEFLGLFTELPMEEVRKLGALEGAALNDAKAILATEAVSLAHGRDAAQEAARSSRTVFAGTGVGAMPTASCPADPRARLIPLSEFVVAAGLAESKAAARRLAVQGGLRVNESVRTDADGAVDPADFIGEGRTMLVSAGRKRHACFVLEGPDPILPAEVRVGDRADGSFEILGFFSSGTMPGWDCMDGPFEDRDAAVRSASRIRTASEQTA